jgi:hypothetical protein
MSSRFTPDPFHQTIRSARLYHAIAIDRTLPFLSEIQVSAAPLAEQDKSFTILDGLTSVTNLAESPAFTREFVAEVAVDVGPFDLTFSCVNTLTTVTSQPQTLVFSSEIETTVI